MLKRLHRILVLTLIAVIACGNGLSFAAPMPADHHRDQVAAAQAASPHEHQHSHATHKHADADSASLADDCGDSGCTSSDHDNYPCCHTHGHCCTSSLSIADDNASTAPVLGDGSLLLAAAASVPLGTVTYPLLRPPRNSV